MSADDPKRARSMAFQLVGDLAREHAATLSNLSRAEDLESALPLAEARARFQKKVAPSLHHVFEDALRVKILRPLEKRVAEEREAEDREAVRDDLGYRTAEDRPRPKPVPSPEPEKRQPRKKHEKLEPGLREYRSTGTIFLGVGIACALGMAAIGIGASRTDSLAHRAQTTFVAQTCTIVESRDVRTEGGGSENVIAFESEKNGKRYRHHRYSPDVDHGPGASWMPVGKVTDCVCDPNDPALCFLYAGKSEGRESTPWVLIVVIPLLFLGIGLMMRNAKKIPDGD